MTEKDTSGEIAKRDADLFKHGTRFSLFTLAACFAVYFSKANGMEANPGVIIMIAGFGLFILSTKQDSA